MSAPARTRTTESEFLEEFEEPNFESSNGLLVTRTLKPPPEIWELVHPVQEKKFHPGVNFARHLVSKNVLLGLLAAVAIVAAGTAVWKYQVVQKVMAVLNAPDPPRKPLTPKTVKPVNIQASKPTLPASTDTSQPVVSPISPAPEESFNTEVIQTTSTTKRKVKRPASEPKRAVAGSTAPTSAIEPTPRTQSTAPAIRPERATVANPAQEKPVAVKPALPESSTPAKTEQKPKPKVIQWP